MGSQRTDTTFPILNLYSSFASVFAWLMLFLLMGGLAPTAVAQTYNDTPGAAGCSRVAGGPFDWNDADCWDQSDAPNTTDADVVLDNGKGYAFGSSSTITINSLDIQDGTFNEFTQSIDFTIDGGSVTVSDTLLLGGGSMTINSGTFTNNESTKLNGGTLTVAGNAGNGTSNIANLRFGSGGKWDIGGNLNNGTDGTLFLSDGTLSLAGDFTNNGSLEKSSGALVEFDGTENPISPQSLSGDFSTVNNNAFEDFVIRQNREVDPDNELSGNGSGEPVSINGKLSIESGAQYGQGDPGTRDNQEDADLAYNGNNFEVTGTLFSNRVKLGSQETTGIQGAVFAELQVLDQTTAQLNENFALLGLLTINNGGAFDVNGKLLVLEGDVEVNGNFIASSGGTVRFRGGRRETCCSGSGLSGGPDKTQQVIGTSDITFSTLEVQDSTDVDIDGASIDDGNSTNDTVVDFIGSSSVSVGGSFTVDEALVKDERPFTAEGNVTIQNGGDVQFRNGARLTFFAGNNQSVSAPSGLTVSSTELDKSSGTVTVNDPITVQDTLVLSRGTLDSQGNVKLPTGGVVKYNGGGSLSSDLIAERRLSGTGGSAWYAITPPQPGVTYKELEESGPNDIWTSGNVNSDDPTPDSGSVAIYNESDTGVRSMGYEYPDLTTSPSKGSEASFFYVYSLNAGFPKTLAAPGVPRTNTSFTYSLSHTDNQADGSGDPEDGWNLISVPYLTVVDWDDFDFSDSCIDNTVYVHEPGTGEDSNYSGSILEYTPGGSGSSLFEEYGYISPFQSFWVHTTCSPTPQLNIGDITVAQVTKSDRSNDGAINDSPFQKSTLGNSEEGMGLIRFVMDVDGLLSETQFGFRETGTMSKDPWDAFELTSLSSPSKTERRLSLYSVLDNGTGLDINVLPGGFDQNRSIPVVAKAKGCDGTEPYGGSATLKWPTLRDLPSGMGVVLEDTKADTLINLQTQSKYEFTIESSTDSGVCDKAAPMTKRSGQETIPPPTPNVVQFGESSDSQTSKARGAASKAEATDTRFKLHLKPNAALPVEFSSMNGNVDEQDALLTWKTASETNNAGFQVQRKADGSFTDVNGGFVESKADGGTTDQTQSYRYRVEDLDAGSHTFRLKQVNTDGTATFSDPIDVKIGLAGDYSLTTYPNPVSERATVEFAVKEKENVTIQLYNTLGQRVKTLYRDTPPAEQTKRVRLSTDDLSSGLYFVRMRGESFTATKRVTVVK